MEEKYAIIAVTNGNFAIKTEHGNNKKDALVSFHQLSASYWNADDVQTAVIMIVNDRLNVVDGKIEYITKPQTEE